MPGKVARFQRRGYPEASGAYKCVVCGKRTRETGEDESSAQMCLRCYRESGQENVHTDCHGGRMADCPECQRAFQVWGYTLGTEDRWCDRTDRVVRMRCDQCAPLMINGVFCHETGCPNSKKEWDPENGVWFTPEEEEET